MPDILGPEAIVGDFVVGESEEPSPVPALVTAQTVDVSVKAEVLNGVWETFGVDRDIEVDPETLIYEFDEWGPLKASFVLKRDPWSAWPDLSPFTPIEVEVGGVLVWEGRTEGTPLKAGAEAQISVQCSGWASHLDDDLYKRVYVHATLTDWKDARSFSQANLASLTAAPQIQAEAQKVTLTWPKGTATDGNAAVILDLGEACAKVVVVKWEWTAGEANRAVKIGTSNVATGTIEEPALEIGPDTGGATGTSVLTFATPRRYVIVAFDANSHTPVADETFTVTEALVFSQAEYESGGVSVLKASTVIETALPFAPLLSRDLSQINPYAGTAQPALEDSFDIPSLVITAAKTPRQAIEATNSFHNWLTYVDLQRRMVFKPPSEEPEWEYGAWSGEQIEDASAGEAADIYDSVIVEGAAANGEALSVTVTAAELGDSTIVGERGFTRAKVISLSNATDETVMRKIGEVWLADQLVIPFGGAITAPVGALRSVLGGAPQHPSLIGYHVNQMLRVSNAISPDDGGVGRDGRIVSAVYSHAEQVATVTLGARTSSVEALLSRLAVVQEASS
jgi:hypothetical protein